MLKKITFFALCFGTSCCFSAPVNIDQEQDKLWDVMRSGSGDEVLKIMERLSPRYSEMNDEQKSAHNEKQ